MQSTTLAHSGLGTQTPDSIEYRHWQHEDAATSFARLRRWDDAPADALVRLLLIVAITLTVAVCAAFIGVLQVQAASPVGNVRVTTYKANIHETDGDPNTTASGAKVADGQIAVSRDLLWRNGGMFRWGDTLRITAPGQHERCNRTYVVQDTMARRWRKRVDIFLPKGVAYFSCYNVTIEKVE